jgi:hypothetical protein
VRALIHSPADKGEIAGMDQALTLRVRERAYHIWAAHGEDADQNWLRAGAEILNNSATQSSAAQPEKKQPGAFKRKAKKTVSVGQAASSPA